jgi:two-component system response regulator YesN
LLLVDDEPNILMGLRAMIEREFPNRYAIRFASDGAEAWGVVSANRVDLMICDIRMPTMDGLELIQRMQALERKPAVVILSGHDDFQYAREAIRCDVREYMLKPIVRGELFKALLRLEDELERREAVERRLSLSASQERQLIESRFENIFLNASLDERDIRGMLDSSADWLNAPFQVALCKSMGVRGESRDGFLTRLDPMLESAGGEHGVSFVRVPVRGGLIAVVSSPAYLERLASSTAALSQGFDPIGLAVSRAAEGAERLRSAYDEAAFAMKHMFLQSRPGVIRYEDVAPRSGPARLPVEEIEKMYNMLGTNREQELSALVHGLFGAEVVRERSIDYFEEVSALLNERVFDRVFQMYGKESVEILRLFKRVSEIGNFHFLNDYVRDVEELLLRLSEYVKSIKSAQFDNRAMKDAIRYIAENYHKDINMATVSNAISLNYSYFSYAFKEYTGENFGDYLRGIRIERAKEKLRTTDSKIYEIATEVGFENVKHFNRVFKKLEGVAPQEYRERQLLDASR